MGILDIFNESSLLKIRLVIYGLLVILSFLIFVGVSVMMGKVGKCPLYAELNFGIYYDGPESNCDYPIAVAVIFQLVFLILRMISLILVTIGKLSKEAFLFSDFFEFIYVVIDLIAFLLTFVGACILSAGSQESFDFPYTFNWEASSKVAQGGAWTSAILWLIIGLVGLRVLWTSGKIPFIGSRSQDSSPQSGKGQRQTELVDPASERFRV